MRVGESSGQVDEILDRMAVYYEKQYETRQKVKAALTYPTLLFIITIVIFIFMLSFIVPRFTSMFSSLNAELPTITRVVLSLSHALQQYWIYLFVLIAICLIIFIYTRNIPSINFPASSIIRQISLWIKNPTCSIMWDRTKVYILK